MKDHGDQQGRTSTNRAGVVGRFFCVSVFVGLLIGLFEAVLLWTTPRVIPLLVHDVGWVIWCLAPLVDMAFFGLVGLGFGWLSRRFHQAKVLAAFEAAFMATFVFFVVEFHHSEIGMHPFSFRVEVVWPLAVFAFLLGLFFLFFQAVWRWLSDFEENRLPRLKRPIISGLGVATVVAVAGIGIFVAGPSFSTKTVSAASALSGAPNIVFITLDTVRADHLSSYGYSRRTTPNIDRFARTGVLFENAIAPTSWTLASHASMFTGLLPQQHGADWASPLGKTPSTLAEILRSSGYETGGVVANLLYLQRGWGIAQGFEQYDDNHASFLENISRTFLGETAIQPLYQALWKYNWMYRQNAKDIDNDAMAWLQHCGSRPFFLFINYFDVHDPYVTSPPFSQRFGSITTALNQRFHEAVTDGDSVMEFKKADRASLVNGYDDCLAYLDSEVGRLLDHLRRSPVWRKTIVIITSDHGEEFGEHGSYEHGRNLYWEVLHVPLIIAGPGIPKDVRIRHIVGTRQLFSTVLDLAGGVSTPFSQTSLTRFWDSGFKTAPMDGAVVSELVPSGDLDAKRPIISLTTAKWQYIEHRDGRVELYNWVTDPKEEDNLAASLGEKATLEGLRLRLIKLVSNATGPWRGVPYLRALYAVKGPARLGLLRPRPLQPGSPGSKFRIGIAQAFFESGEGTPIRPSKPDQELMQSLPYQ